MTGTHTRLDTIVNLIKMRKVADSGDKAWLLDEIVWEMAAVLKAYCLQQGKNCEQCKFKLDEPERKNYECRINIGKNTLGTAPRFWELFKKGQAKDEETEESVPTGLSGQETGVP